MKMQQEPLDDCTTMYGFEGPEKKLEIDFRAKDGAADPVALGFRAVTRREWDVVLQIAQCTIISTISNEYCDAYLLSESSLFVYPCKILIKTCGTTTLLRAVPVLLEIADRLGLREEFLQYSRASFRYPNKQLFPHTSFDHEVEFLDDYFPHGESYVLGTADGATEWHLYIADSTNNDSREQSFEVFMFDLDPDSMRNFMFESDRMRGSAAGVVTTKTSGIRRILDISAEEEQTAHPLVLDAFNFDPCGYSMNGLQGKTYFTIHVTPEAHCSYVSFECNADIQNFTRLLTQVTSVFQPRKFAVGILADVLAPAGLRRTRRAVDWDSPAILGQDYCHIGEATFLRMGDEFEYCASLCGYGVARDSAPRKVPKLAILPEVVGTQTPVDKVGRRYNAKALRYERGDDDLVRAVLANPKEREALVNLHIPKPVLLVDVSKVQRRLEVFAKTFEQCAVPRVSLEREEDIAVLAILALGNGTFQTSAVRDVITLVEDLGVAGDRIVVDMTNVTQAAMERIASVTTGVVVQVSEYSSVNLIRKVASLFPGSLMELSISDIFDGTVSELASAVTRVLTCALDEGLRPGGLAFDLSEDCAEPSVFRKAVARAHGLVARMKCSSSSVRRSNVKLEMIHFSGGYPGCGVLDGVDYSQDGLRASDVLEEYFPAVGKPQVSLGPGRFFTGDAYAVAVSVVGRGIHDSLEAPVSYTVNDGVYGSLTNEFLADDGLSSPVPVQTRRGNKQMSTVFGPSGDVSRDVLWRGVLPPLEVNDCLLWKNVELNQESVEGEVWRYVLVEDARI
eukprot:Plantae.Rhodophyta-Rhodochaete_pulchella.ctg9683.p1 GENE.Plantae.Rhodophyta-Rhodochaete_pulchella.ctg9683~~Plantae.Rhodophyta-Rhodochaete_pulchella.ctg9683.p1  ORF type:complete len:792 (-),score=129.17 Plantae.Rhodophyta-Rhodochaete_pulchella.ctg9683:248-2623(-)